MLNYLYKYFPRQLATPLRKTVDKNSFYQIINKSNGKMRIFASVYNYTGDYEIDNKNLVLDKIFFDFDGDDCYDKTKFAIDYLTENGYKFLLVFSGGGFHIYLFTEGYGSIKNSKQTLVNAHSYFIRCGFDFDRAIKGDTARVATIPNTYNNKRKLYAIPISIDDFHKGLEHIKEMAKKQNFRFVCNGGKYFDINRFDTEDEETEYKVSYDENIKVDVEGADINTLPPCIHNLIRSGKMGFRNRFLTIVYLRDAGWLPNMVESLFNQCLSKKEANHCIKEEKQVRYLFNRDVGIFPNCENIKKEGTCPLKGFCDRTRIYQVNYHLVDIYR